MNSLFLPGGIKIMTTSALPVAESFTACCLISKKEVNVLSGEFIHILHNKEENLIWVSEEYYKTLNSEIQGTVLVK